jgi:hypothetical protein
MKSTTRERLIYIGNAVLGFLACAVLAATIYGIGYSNVIPLPYVDARNHVEIFLHGFVSLAALIFCIGFAFLAFSFFAGVGEIVKGLCRPASRRRR